MADQFSIDAKLVIAGVEVKGDLDAGTLKFKVDTSALTQLVQDAEKAAAKVKAKFDNIKLNKLKIEVNKNSLRSMKAQIRNTIQEAVSEVDFGNLGAPAGKGGGKGAGAGVGKAATNPFQDQLKAAAASARSLTTLHGLTKNVNTAFRSLLTTLGKISIAGGAAAPPGARAAGGLGVVSATAGQPPLPPGARPGGVGRAAAAGPVAENERRVREELANIERAKLARDDMMRSAIAGQARFDVIKDKSLQRTLRALDRETNARAKALRAAIEGDEKAAANRLKIEQDRLAAIDERTAKEVAALQKAIAEDNRLSEQQLKNQARVRAARDRDNQKRISDIKRLQKEFDALFAKERKLTSQLGAGGGRGGFGGGVPPGGIGGTPPGGDFDKSRGDVRRLAEGMREVSQNARRASNQVETLDALAFQVGRKAAAFRGVAIAINSIIQAVQAAVKFIIDFNDALIELNKILQFSDSGIQRIGNQVFELSRETGVAVEETVKITEAFARAGLEGRGFGGVVDLTATALRGYQGTTLEAAQASTLLIQILQQVESGARGLNKELITSGKLFDILGRVEDITASKAQDFAEAFRRSGASLVATGASIEEIAGLISVVQERTQRGGEVIGTAFKTIATRISNSSSEAAKSLRSIGVEVTDAHGRLRNINDILRDVAGRFDSLTEAEQANIATKVAGVRQIEIFRNVVADFGRVLDVQREAQLAEGDAARKQADEQDKLANVLQRVQLNIQKLIKTASEGITGRLFKAAIDGAELLTETISKVDEVLGGAISSLAALGIGLAAVKILPGLFLGMFQTLKFFIGGMKEAETGLQRVTTTAQLTKSAGIDPMNMALHGSVEVINIMNAEMQEFQAATELAAVKAERLAKARQLAQAQITPAQLVGDPQAVEKRTQALLAQQEFQERLSRQRGIKAATQRVGARAVSETIAGAPGVFTERERAVAARRAEIEAAGGREKFFAGRRAERGIVGFDVEKTAKATSKLGKGMEFLRKNTLGVAVGAGLLGSVLKKLGDTAKEADQPVAALGLTMLGTAGQFASFGALFGPMGVAIGGALGAIVGFIDGLGSFQITVQTLAKEYEALGLVQKEAGELSAESATLIEKAFANIEAFQQFIEQQQKRQLEETLDPEKAAKRKERAEKALASAGKDLLASIDLQGAPAENLKKVQQFLTGLQKVTTTGAAIDFAVPGGGAVPGTKGALQIGKEVEADIRKTLLDAVKGLEEFAPGAVKAMEELFDKIEQDVAVETGQEFGFRTARNNLDAAVSDFTNIIRESIPKKEVQRVVGGQVIFDQIDQGAKALERILSGDLVRGTKDFDKVIGELRKKIAEQKILGPDGKPITLKAFDVLVQRAEALAQRARRLETFEAGGEAALRTGAFVEEGSELLRELSEAAKEQRSLQDRAKRLQAQQEAAVGIGAVRDLGALDFEAGVDKIEIVLRQFADNFAKTVRQLQAATLKATTPQEQLAQALAEQARVNLEVARGREEIVRGDVGAEILTALEALGGGAFAVGIDPATGEPRRGIAPEEAEQTRNEIRQAILNGVLEASDEITRRGIVDDREIRRVLGESVRGAIPQAVEEAEFEKILEAAGKGLDKLLKARIDTLNKEATVSATAVAALKALIAQKERDLKMSQSLTEVRRAEAQTAMVGLTGLRLLAAQRELESSVVADAVKAQKKFIASLDEELDRVNKAIDLNKDDVAAQNELEVLTRKRFEAQISLEKTLAKSASDTAKARLDAAKLAFEEGKRLSGIVRRNSKAQAEINNILRVGGTQIEKFNAKLNDNNRAFRESAAELAAEIQFINENIEDEAERRAQVNKVIEKGNDLAIEHAKVEAEVIAARRDAIKQVSQELVANADQQVQAQAAVIEATKQVGEAFESYIQAVDGAILANTQYNLSLALAEAQSKKTTGAFTGVRDELIATQQIFRDVENSARDMGASEKTLVQIRRQSIDQQLALFNQLLSEQSSLARQFFTSNAQDQADLFRGIQEAKGVAEILGGSFEEFKKKGEGAINDLGAQILSLPQETRQRVISALETLQKVGGRVGDFTASELLTAIETAALGVSGEGLEVDPLFELQERIADLNEEQAKLATEQLIAATEGVETAKQQLEEAEAQKDLAEIQLERTIEEGEKLRGKLGELKGTLNTTLLRQTETNRSGFASVARAVAGMRSAILNNLPGALSVKVGQAFRQAMEESQPLVQQAGTEDLGVAFARVQEAFGDVKESVIDPLVKAGTQIGEKLLESAEGVAETFKALFAATPAETRQAVMLPDDRTPQERFLGRPVRGGPITQPTPQSRGLQQAQAQREQGSNAAEQAQFFGSSGRSVIIPSQQADRVPQPRSNNPNDDTQQQTNSLLDQAVDLLKDLVGTSTTSSETLEEIKDNQDTGAAAPGAAAATPAEFNVMVEGTQTVNVTGFEAGVTRVAQALAETFGGFATEAEAETAARQIIEPIVQELINRGIIQRNQV